jgi:hypothetical protein
MVDLLYGLRAYDDGDMPMKMVLLDRLKKIG